MPRKKIDPAALEPQSAPPEASPEVKADDLAPAPRKRTVKKKVVATVGDDQNALFETPPATESVEVPAPSEVAVIAAETLAEAIPVSKPVARRKKEAPLKAENAATPPPVAEIEPTAPIEAEEAPTKIKAPARARKSKVTLPTAEPIPTEPAFSDLDGFMQVSFRAVAPTTGAAPQVKQGKNSTAPAFVSEIAPALQPEEDVALTELESGELTILEWRSKPVAGGAAKASPPVESSDRSRTNKRRQKGQAAKELVQAESMDSDDEYDPFAEDNFVEAPETPKAAPIAPAPVYEAPKKLPIPVPANAPQVVVRDGVPLLVRDHRIYPPIIFFGNASDDRRAETVFEELKMASESGIHLHSFLVELCVDPKQVDESAGIAGYLLSKAVQIDPEAQVIFRIEFKSPRSWEEKFPDALYSTDSGHTAEPSLCDEKFWSVAEECLEVFVKKILLLGDASHIFGLHLERGEWFQPADHGFDNSRAATKQFQAWARRRYLNDEVTLRASWFDGGVRFDTISVPPFNPTGMNGDHFIRSSRKQRRYVDYHLFLSDETVIRISDLAYAAKKASEGMLLIGVSYGYTFEWSHPASGHLALGKLLRTDEIDFIAGPPSYRNRGTGGSAPFPCPIDSFALNGKLYISEEDYKTSLSRGHEPDDFNPPLRTPQALESVHWRGAGVALAHGTGVEWMDVWGNGWLKTHSVWERSKIIGEALINRMEAPLADPDVAVFIDERALAYLVDSNAFNLLVQSVRESILRAGVSAGFYLLSDLQHREKFPESKLYLFLNAWDIRPELRAAIKSRLQRDNKVLFWLYAAGLFDAGRESLERAREVTGIALKPQPFHSRSGTTILNRRHPLVEAFPERSLTGEAKMEPSYFAIPEEGTVLGEYTQTGLPSFVVKEFKEDHATAWTSVFMGEPVVNPALIRALAQMAGAHIWNFHEDVVHVRGPFCTIHCSVTGPRTLTFPSRSCAYNVLNGDWVAIDATSLKFYGIDGSTHVFLVGQKGEIESFLEKDPTKALHMENIPVRDSNVRVDTSNFDVAIMKLDEWMEGGDQDDVADEWFLRPQAILEETEVVSGQAEESPEEVGKRRRKRRRSRGGDDGFNRSQPNGKTESATVNMDSEEPFTMNIVFRKRD